MAQLKDTEVSGNLTVSGSINGKASTAGTADNANKLNSDAGSTNQPIYFTGGKPAGVSSVGITYGGTGATTAKNGFINLVNGLSDGGTPGGTERIATFNGSNNAWYYPFSKIKSEILLAAHPVGSYYWSSSSTDPKDLFGGTWERIKDRFVYAQGDSGKVGTKDGSVSHKIGTANLPPHTHDMTHDHLLGEMNFTGDLGWAFGPGNNMHGIYYGNIDQRSHTGVFKDLGSWTPSSPAGQGESGYQLNFNAKNGYNNKPTAGASKSNTGNGGFANTALDTMPPYITAYCWKRTA